MAIIPWLAMSAAVRPSSASSVSSRQLRGAEGGVRRHPDRAPEREHLVVDERQLVEHAGQRRGDRAVGVDDGAGLVAAVGAEVQLELGGRREVTVDGLAVEIDDHDLTGLELGQDRAGGRHGHELADARRHVAGGAQHEPLRGQSAGGGGDRLARGVKRLLAHGSVGLHIAHTLT